MLKHGARGSTTQRTHSPNLQLLANTTSEIYSQPPASLCSPLTIILSGSCSRNHAHTNLTSTFFLHPVTAPHCSESMALCEFCVCRDLLLPHSLHVPGAQAQLHRNTCRVPLTITCRVLFNISVFNALLPCVFGSNMNSRLHSFHYHSRLVRYLHDLASHHSRAFILLNERRAK